MATCPTCHAEIPPGVRFCDACGASMDTGTSRPGAAAPPPAIAPVAGGRRSVLRTIAIVAGGAGVVVAVGLAAAALLILTGDPSPCADRSVASSPAAAAALTSRWDAFKVAAAKSSAEVAFSEAEVTSRGTAYVDEKDAPVEDLQVHFCPDGRAQAKATVSAIGMKSHVLVTGTLDLTGTKPVIRVTDAKAGNLPGALARRIVDSVLDSDDFRTLQLGPRITAISYSDGSTRLAGGP